jgi:RND family efflux transporter MFP subunit
MTTLRLKLLPLLVLVTGLGVAYVVLVARPAPEPRAAPAIRAPLVDVVAAEPADIALSVSSQGTVAPRLEVNIVSRVAGVVESESPSFAEGGFFDANAELLKVEDADYRFALVRAEARVADAQQLVAQEKGRTRQAAREWRDLGNDEANDLFLRKPQLAGSQAALLAAKADLGEARLQLERTSFSVPFNGRVSEKHVGLGQFLSPGSVIARVYATDVVEIRLPLTDRQLALLDLPLSYADHSEQKLSPTPVTLKARFADREWEWLGHIVRTDATIDVDSRVLYAVVEVLEPFAQQEDPEHPPLSIGLFVNAEISGRTLPGVSTLPRIAVRNDDTVLVVDAEQKIWPRSVRVLKSSLRQAWVQGLEAGDRVVVTHLPVAVAGMSVTVREGHSVAGGEL